MNDARAGRIAHFSSEIGSRRGDDDDDDDDAEHETRTQGLVMLGIVVSVDSLKAAAAGGGSVGESLFFVAIYVIALGTGGYLPAFQALGADQFDSDAEKTAFFGWLFFFTNVGAVLANTVIVYVEGEGHWSLGYWLGAAAGAAALLVFAAGVPTYRQFRRGGNPFTRIAQVFSLRFSPADF
jgi:peptide/histidine transporter 3/4